MKITACILRNFWPLLPQKLRSRRPLYFLSALWLALALVAVATALPGLAQAAPLPRWDNPAGGQVEVLRKFDKPAQKWQAGHRGVDLSMTTDEIRAPADGVVSFSGKVVDRTVITLEHTDGRKSSFEPVIDPLPVGSRVKAGQVIAHLDPAIEHCPQSCIHWGVRDESDGYLNPLLFLGLEDPSVLLPIGADFSA